MVLFPNQVDLWKYFLIFSADDETIPTTFGPEMYSPWSKDETQLLNQILDHKIMVLKGFVKSVDVKPASWAEIYKILSSGG